MNISTNVGEIAFRNDVFRRRGHGMVLTSRARELPGLKYLLENIRNFNNFSPDNDPYGEHDFGTLDWYGEKVFWKIDYYDMALSAWKDPLSAECNRILTVMRADEY